MKKVFKIFYLFLIASALLLPIRVKAENGDDGEENTNGSLIIDTELDSSSGGKQTTFVDETDLHKLFIPETENEINNLKQEEASAFIQEKDMLFQKKTTLKESGEEYRSILFQANQTIKNSEGDTISLEVRKKPIPVPTMILGAMGLTVMIFSVIFSRRKRREKDERR